MHAFSVDYLSKDYRHLIEIAEQARANAYVPISGFKVGAAVLCRSGAIYQGANVEISSFTPTICAERSALFHAYSQGERDIVAIAVVGSRPDVSPCGVCRQVILELAPNADVLFIGPEGYILANAAELLPVSFRWEGK